MERPKQTQGSKSDDGNFLATLSIAFDLVPGQTMSGLRTMHVLRIVSTSGTSLKRGSRPCGYLLIDSSKFPLSLTL